MGLFFFSQTGNTRLVAQALHEEFRSRGALVGSWPLTYPEDREALPTPRDVLENYDVVGVGTPVHYFNPVPVVMDWLRSLEVATRELDMRATENRRFGFAFCTYGGLRYGSSLRDVGRALVRARVSVLGGFSVAAPGNFPGVDYPPGLSEQPDADAKAGLVSFVCGLLSKHGRAVAGEAKGQKYASRQTLAKMGDASSGFFERVGAAALGTSLARDLLPKVVLLPGKCHRCMKCVAACPTGNVHPEPEITVGDDCIKCYQCVAACPHGALEGGTSVVARAAGLVPKRNPSRYHHFFL
ncbi:MAG: hypothetical protein Kow0069_09910 [Promethearchaeota archaeon]